MRIKQYNKLVRDRIPAIISSNGGQATVSVLDEAAYLRELDKKLNEEVAEYHAVHNMEELADVLEVIDAICKARGFDLQEIKRIQAEKAAQRGSFAQRVFLHEVQESS